MNLTNEIKFELKEVYWNQIEKIDGISFSNIVYILVFIDGVNLFTTDYFNGSFLVFKELKNSILKSGKYLLFTCASGIADDSGWEYVEVIHNEKSVLWNILRDGTSLSYKFDRNNYLKKILEIEEKIKCINPKLKLEPLFVIYPE